MPVIPVLWRRLQKDQKFNTILFYIAQAWDIQYPDETKGKGKAEKKGKGNPRGRSCFHCNLRDRFHTSHFPQLLLS